MIKAIQAMVTDDCDEVGSGRLSVLNLVDIIQKLQICYQH